MQILYLSTLANGGLNDSEAVISMSVTKKRENQPKQFEDTELLLKPGETVNTDRHRQQMINLNDTLIEKRPVWSRRHGKVIDKAPSHAAKLVKDTLTALGWEILPHPSYSPDLTASDYHLFSSMGHALAEQYFHSYEEVQKWLDWFCSRDFQFFWNGIHNLSTRCQNV